LRRVAEEHGRDPDSIEINVFGARPDAGNLEHYRNIGVVRTCLALPSASADVVLPLLDKWAKLVQDG
jgi:hypothetical protein